MRDRRFVAVHRGGTLEKQQQYDLMGWACTCARHLQPLADPQYAELLQQALSTGEGWPAGSSSAGDCMKAARRVHAAAREMDSVSCAVARAVGHAVATAHAGDHALGPAIYGVKAAALAGKDPQAERQWEIKQLPITIRDLVLHGLKQKERKGQ